MKNDEQTHQGTNLYTMTETALEVSYFFSKLSDPILRTIYKQIIENATKLASLLPFQVVKKQVIDSLSFGIEYSVDAGLVFKFLEIDEQACERIKVLMDDDGADIASELAIYCTWKSLPLSLSFMPLYEYYTSPFREYSKMSREICQSAIYTFLDTIKIKFGDSILCDDAPEMIDKCFALVPYQYYFMNALSGKFSLSCLEKYVHFVRLFCFGQLIDAVLDTIANCGIYSVSEYLWDALIDRCEESKHFSAVVEKRYSVFRRHCPILPAYDFKNNDEQAIIEQNNGYPALEQIVVSATDFNPITEVQMSSLISALVNRGDISVDNAKLFRDVFRGTNHSVCSQLQWMGTMEQLACFLELAWCDKVPKRDYTERSALVFVQRNGKRCSPISLGQPKSDINPYKRVFNEAGILR